MQQKRQRIVRRMSSRNVGVGARRRGIAVADRQQAMGDRMPAAGVTPFATATPDTFRRAPQSAQHRPYHHGRDDDDAEPQRKYRQRGHETRAAPRQRYVAGLLGNPG